MKGVKVMYHLCIPCHMPQPISSLLALTWSYMSLKGQTLSTTVALPFPGFHILYAHSMPQVGGLKWRELFLCLFLSWNKEEDKVDRPQSIRRSTDLLLTLALVCGTVLPIKGSFLLSPSRECHMPANGLCCRTAAKND